MTDEKPQDDIIDIEPQVVNDDTPPARAPRKALRNGSFVALVALLAALGGGWLYRDVLASYLPNDEVHALSMRVDALEAGSKDAAKRMDAVIALTDELKAQLGAAQAAAEKAAKTGGEMQALGQGNAAAIADLRKGLDELGTDVASLKQALANGAGGTAAADPALVQRLEALEKSLAGLQGAAPAKLDVAALKQALAGLNSKAASGAPFVDEYAAIAKAVPAAEGLDVLKAEAATGLPGNAALGAALDKVIAQLPKAAAGGTGDGWLDRIGNFFSGLVTIKSLGSDDWPTAAAKASAFVAAGDLQQAETVFTGMEGQPPAALEDWHALLKRRIALDAALARVNAAVARDIAAKG